MRQTSLAATLQCVILGNQKAAAFGARQTALRRKTLKILALEADAPGADVRAFTTALLQAESRRAWELVQAGVIRELYFRADRHAAVLVLECAATQEAHDVLATLPLVAAGLITFEVIPLAPYPGFARLFSEP